MRSVRCVMSRLGVLAASVLTGSVAASLVSAQAGYVAVGRAECGPGSRPEAGLQGQMAAAERFSAPRAYPCNLELVGSTQGKGRVGAPQRSTSAPILAGTTARGCSPGDGRRGCLRSAYAEGGGLPGQRGDH